MSSRCAGKPKPIDGMYSHRTEGEASITNLGFALLFDVFGKRFGEGYCAADKGRRPTKMPGDLGSRLRVAQHVHDFPNGDSMTEHIGFTARRGVSESDAGKFLFERFFLQVNAAECGNFQMATLRLPCQ
jgi:hypothetical protein